MNADRTARLKKFYNELTDRPLEPSDAFYVPFLDGKAGGDPIKDLFTRISFSEAASVNLLTGQRGTGKSTELRRLRKLLEDDGCIVFLGDMYDYMNLTTPVDITDFFISIMGALGEEVGRRYKSDIAREKYWTRIVKFFTTEVIFKDVKVSVDAGVAKAEIAGSLRDDPTFRQRLQEGLSGHVSRMVREAYQFASEVVDFVREREGDPNKKVVFLVDSLEQIRGAGANSDQVYASVQNVFSGHADKLCIPKLHVVYNVPPYLSTLVPNPGNAFGGAALHTLPSIHIRATTGAPDPAGLAVMENIVHRRYPDWKQFFNKPQLDRLGLNAGGDLRDFFRLIKDCIVRATSMQDADGPMPDEVLENAENMLRSEMLPISNQDKAWLKKIATKKTPELEEVKLLPTLARFFDTHVVLNYRNSMDWYDVHPLLLNAINT